MWRYLSYRSLCERGTVQQRACYRPQRDWGGLPAAAAAGGLGRESSAALLRAAPLPTAPGGQQRPMHRDHTCAEELSLQASAGTLNFPSLSPSLRLTACSSHIGSCRINLKSWFSPILEQMGNVTKQLQDCHEWVRNTDTVESCDSNAKSPQGQRCCVNSFKCAVIHLSWGGGCNGV